MTRRSNDEHDSGLKKQVEDIVAQGPAGAFAVAGIATAIVVILYFAFYFFIYLPRGAVQ
ncbi:hypothetical protein [Steroidobacter sp.]|uniref:hypothetical protein n=1 Tax=Steroidobacter sp. TaxID=1978227 RepID=UPI001A51F0F1|nr:hypothetical protein [Steroidobacter sp.]MBL8268141.1 hypothetical protein [Steroidobacter sp.]